MSAGDNGYMGFRQTKCGRTVLNASSSVPRAVWPLPTTYKGVGNSIESWLLPLPNPIQQKPAKIGGQ